MEVMHHHESAPLTQRVVEIDEDTVATVLGELLRQPQLPSRVLLDLRRLRYVGSEELHALLRAVRRMKTAGSEVAVVCGPGPVWTTLHRVGFDSIVAVEPEIASVLAGWSGSPVLVSDRDVS